MDVPKKVTLSFDVGTKNLAYCLVRNDDEIILDWNVVDISATTCEKQCQRMIDAMDLIDYSIGYPEDIKQTIDVIIERQPSRNPKMRVVAGQLQMYFEIEKRACSQNDDLVTIRKVLFYSPKHKLRCYKFMEGDTPIIPKKYSTPYAFRKNLAIQHCGIIIDRKNEDGNYIQEEKWVKYFCSNGSNRKNDLADSYTQLLAYIRGF